MTNKYKITVRRIVREDIEIEVDADSGDAARRQAELEATCMPQEAWDTYDCEYHSEMANQEQGK